MSAQMAAMVAQAEIANKALRELSESHRQHGQTLQALRGDMGLLVAESSRLANSLEKDLTPSLNNVNRASGNAHGTLYQFVQGMIPGQQTAGNITIAIAALAAVFAPFT